MVQAASVLAVMTTPAVSAPVMEPVAHVTRTSANVTQVAAEESPETLH